MRLREQSEITERRRAAQRGARQHQDTTAPKPDLQPAFVYDGKRLLPPLIDGDRRCPLCRKFSLGDPLRDCDPRHFR